MSCDKMVLKKDKTGYYKHKGKWLLLSKHINKKTKKRKVLRIYGSKKPTKSKISKDERIIEWYKNK